MNLRQTYVSYLLGWCLLSLLQTPAFQFGPRAHELCCDNQHVAPYTAPRLVPMCLLTLGLGSEDAETNKVHPEHTHSTGDTLPNTTWPNRMHLGLHDCINLLFFQLSSVYFWISTIMPYFTCASSTYLAVDSRFTLHGPLILTQAERPVGYLQAPGPGYTAVPTASCPSLCSSFRSCSTTFLEMGCTLSSIFFSSYVPICLWLCLCPLCTNRLLWTIFSLLDS